MAKRLGLVTLALLLVGGALALIPSAAAAQDKTVWIPMLCYRTGPYAPGGSGFCGGKEDYFALVNAKGGVEGVKIRFQECETAYDTARGIECYERNKEGALVIYPHSTGIMYALLERATRDKIPLSHIGYGRADAADGTTFPYAFPFISTYWSLASAKVRFIAQREGGEDKLKGKKIALLYIDIPYGRETIPIMERLARRFGFEFRGFPVPPPGLEQGAQWTDIARRFRADWVINRNWGVSCTVPLREAARLGFTREKILGVWWCGSEEDVVPAGEAAKGYLSAEFSGSGRDFPVIQEIIEKVHGAGKGNIEKERIGTAYYNRGVVEAAITVEALRGAMKKFGYPVKGEHMQWAMENLNITEARLKELGLLGLVPSLKTSREDHEGGGAAKFKQWDGTKWVGVSEWIAPYKEIVWEAVKESAAKYRAEKK
ncbi:MAG: ABC transporter substrate-binding protein [Candidatus Rokubacteria bacterium]|nr:ABC transporter substrate-binding protein [Candidatus Rokubacteria bacterium]